jgi:phage gpG-like protein
LKIKINKRLIKNKLASRMNKAVETENDSSQRLNWQKGKKGKRKTNEKDREGNLCLMPP